MKRILVSMCMIMAGIFMAGAQSPTIGSLIKAFNSNSSVEALANLLDSSGFSYRFESKESDGVEYVFSKNCKVLHEEHLNGITYVPQPETARSCIITVMTLNGTRVNLLTVRVYSKSEFNKWVSQLRTLGYKTSGGGNGNHGRSWEYEAKGKPSISIWNDYSNTYVLTLIRY